MAKYVATPIGSGFNSQSNLNQNFEDIEDNFQKVLYRDGSTPNQMEADLDMNDHDIYNVNNIDTLSLSINGQQVVANETFVTPLPDPAGQDGKFIRSNGVSASWQPPSAELVVHADTVADMKALTGLADGASVLPLGYAAAGDHEMRRRRFILTGSPPTSDGGAVIYDDASTGYFSLDDTGHVDVREFGTGTADDTTKFTNALLYAKAGKKLIIGGTVTLKGNVTVDTVSMHIHFLPGAQIVCSPAAGIDSAIGLTSVSRLLVTGQGIIDCNNLCSAGIYVSMASGAYVDVNDVSVTNCKQTGSATVGAAGIVITGASTNLAKMVRVSGCGVIGVTRTVVGGTCAGIVATDAEVIEVSHNYISGVLKGSGTVDADGISVFSQLDTFYKPTSATIYGNTVKNCEGRFVKLQTIGTAEVHGNTFIIDSAIGLITAFKGVDSQTFDCSIHDNKFYFTAAHTGGGDDYVIQTQVPSSVEFTGQPVNQRVYKNNIHIGGTRMFGIFLPLLGTASTGVAVAAATVFMSYRDNTVTSDSVWGTADPNNASSVAFNLKVPETFTAGASAVTEFVDNKVHTTNFFASFGGTANNDLKSVWTLIVEGNQLPYLSDVEISTGAGVATRTHTSRFRIANNSIGSRGGHVSWPFDFGYVMSGSDFVTGAYGTGFSNAPAAFTFAKVKNTGVLMQVDSGAVMYETPYTVGVTPTWTRRGNYTTSAYTTAAFSTDRAISNSATIGTQELGDVLSTLITDLKSIGYLS